MYKEKIEVIIAFCETYLESFLNARLEECNDDKEKLIILLLCQYSLLEDSSKFEALLKSAYQNNTVEAQENLHFLWDEFRMIVQGDFKSTSAADLMKAINDKRFFGRMDWPDGYVLNIVVQYIEHWKKQKIMVMTASTDYPNSLGLDQCEVGEDVLNKLLSLINEENVDSKHKQKYIMSISHIGPIKEEVLHGLVNMLHDPHRSIHRATYKALEIIGPAAVPVLTTLLDQDDVWLRKRVIKAILCFEEYSSDVVPSLIPLMNSKNRLVRRDVIVLIDKVMSVTALSSMQLDVVRPLVVMACADSRQDVRKPAINILPRFKGFAQAELMMLQQALLDCHKVKKRDDIGRAISSVSQCVKGD